MPAAGAPFPSKGSPPPPLKSSERLFRKVTFPESPQSPGCLWEEPSLGKLGRGGGQGKVSACLWGGGVQQAEKGSSGKVNPFQTHNLLSGWRKLCQGSLG